MWVPRPLIFKLPRFSSKRKCPQTIFRINFTPLPTLTCCSFRKVELWEVKHSFGPMRGEGWMGHPSSPSGLAQGRWLLGLTSPCIPGSFILRLGGHVQFLCIFYSLTSSRPSAAFCVKKCQCNLHFKIPFCYVIRLKKNFLSNPSGKYFLMDLPSICIVGNVPGLQVMGYYYYVYFSVLFFFSVWSFGYYTIFTYKVIHFCGIKLTSMLLN